MISVRGKNMPCVGNLELYDVMNSNGIMDHFTQKAHLDVYYTSSTTTKTVNDLNKTGMNRGEFCELLVRLSQRKYLESGQTKSQVEAVEMLLSNFEIIFELPGLQEWRKNFLWTIDV